MAMRIRRHKNDSNKYAAAPDTDYDVLRKFVMTVTMLMMTAIANATVPVAATPKTTMYSSAIEPYDNEPFKTNKKEGKLRWNLITKTAKGWKKDGISTTVEHANNILDIFKDRSVQFGLENIMTIPTSGTESVNIDPQNIIGLDYYNADMKYYIKILMS